MSKSKTKKVEKVKQHPCLKCGDTTSDDFKECGNCLAMEHIKKEKPYALSIQLGDEVLKGSGDTALEALQSIAKPVKIFTKGLIKLSYGEQKVEQTWPPARIKRLFYPQAQGFLSKQLSYLLK